MVLVSTVILPTFRWAEARPLWQRAEALGFHAGYTYDHLSWRSFRDRPWYAAIPTLTAAAAVTSSLRLGTMVASPNFRHPVTLAKELVTLDDVSGGRVTLGLGAGGSGYDALTLGQDPWTPRERADRFADFVALLDDLLREPVTTRETTHYVAVEARTIPGCVQRPRLPLHLAAAGPRGMRLTARYADGWVTYGDPRDPAGPTPDRAPAVVADQLARLHDACAEAGRDPGELHTSYLQGSSSERPLDSVDAFVDWAGRYAEVGVDELIVHWPVPDSIFATDPGVFERIATDGVAQLGDGT